MIDEMAGVWRKDAGDTKSSSGSVEWNRTSPVQSSPAAATTRACEVKSGRQRRTEEKIDSNKERERET